MRQWLYRLTDLWALAGGILLLALCAVTFANMVLQSVGLLFPGQTVFVPLAGYEEIIRFGIAVVIFTMFPLCHKEQGHVVAGLFLTKASARVRRVHNRIIQLILLGLVIFLLQAMWVGMMQLRADKAVLSVLAFPQWFFHIPALFSLFLWALLCLTSLFEGSSSSF